MDVDGNAVFTLKDGEVGSWYTDYGNFYVFEEENGEYGKVLDLVEGYEARIVGVGEGTMDISYQIPVDGELSEPVTVEDIPVTDSMIATIEAKQNGRVYLEVDADGNGTVDKNYQLCKEGQDLVLYGDANNDGAINGKDLILLRQSLAGWDVTVDEACADCNADGKINGKDLILLRQYLAGWDVSLGK